MFDPDFVESDRYASLLVREIPAKQRLDVFIDAYREKEDGQGKKLRCFFHALLKRLSKEERNQVYRLVSQELKETDNTDAIRLIIQILPPQCWEKYDEAARLRIENKLIQLIREGRYDRHKERCLAGALGTWAPRIHKYFRLKSDLLHALAAKLESDDQQEQEYVFNFFFGILDKLAPKPTRKLQQALTKGLQAGDVRFRDALRPIMLGGSEEWQKALDEPYKKFEPSEQGDIGFADDDVPF